MQTVQLKFYPEKEKKEAFQKACKKNNDSMNHVLIKYIDDYTEQQKADEKMKKQLKKNK